MVCAHCGYANPTHAQTCRSCGTSLTDSPDREMSAAAQPSGPQRPPLTRRGHPPLNTSWLPTTPAKPPISAAASGLVPRHGPTSIWQAQGVDAATTPHVPHAQGAAASALPGALMGAVYAVYQLMWRRGIFATIAADPIGVSDYAARRSDDLNIVLLVAAIVLVTGSASGAAMWVRRTRLFAAFRGAAIVFGVGLVASVAAAFVCQGRAASQIAAGYVLGGLGCAGMTAALAFVFTRAVQAVVGRAEWVPRSRPALPRVNPSGPGLPSDAITSLRSAPAAPADLSATGLIPPKPQLARHDWTALKGH